MNVSEDVNETEALGLKDLSRDNRIVKLLDSIPHSEA
jgi:hypothetical protein